MDLNKAINDRLSFALSHNKIDATYQELILSVDAKFLMAQAGENNGNGMLYLPYFSCKACGGDPAKVIGVTTSWFLFQMATYYLDKVEDLELVHSTRAEIGVIANLTTGMIFIAD